MASIPWKNCVLYLVPYGTGAWKDLVSGTVYSQSTVASQPAIVEGVNGLPALSFDGTNDSIPLRLTADQDFSTGDRFIVCGIAKNNSATGENIIFGKPADNTTEDAFYLRRNNSGDLVFGSRKVGGSTQRTIKTGVPAEMHYYFAVSHSGEASVAGSINWIGYFNDEKTSINASHFGGDTSLNADSYTGRFGYAATYWLNGSIQALIILKDTSTSSSDHILTDAQHAELNRLLRRRLYLPDSSGTVFYGGAKAVGQWTDKSGNANFVQATAVSQPAVNTGAGLNGQDTLTFATGDFQTLTNSTPIKSVILETKINDTGDSTLFSLNDEITININTGNVRVNTTSLGAAVAGRTELFEFINDGTLKVLRNGIYVGSTTVVSVTDYNCALNSLLDGSVSGQQDVCQLILDGTAYAVTEMSSLSKTLRRRRD